MNRAVLLIIAFGLDAVLGDPAWMPHPVVMMGKGIAWLEKRLRRLFPCTPSGEAAAGVCLAAAMVTGTALVSWWVLRAAYGIHPWIGKALEILWGWQCLAMRGLCEEGLGVSRKLAGGTLDEARLAVGRIVGRDTSRLTKEGVAMAAVESVAENFSDGFFAPLCYLAVGGAPLALVYKAVNTMDSMIGYRSDRYLYFGRAAARMDDLANFFPSRLSAFLMCIAALPAGENPVQAWKIWRRDRLKHESPNSAQTESAMAGALGIVLGGPGVYHGQLKNKPYLGLPGRRAEAEDIVRACRLMVISCVLGVGLLAGLSWMLIR